MIKTTWLAPLGMASILLAPALDEYGGLDLTDLERHLDRTQRSLEALVALESLPLGDTRIERLLEATEPPSAEPRERDRRLDALRDEVGRLRMTLDELELSTPEARVPDTGTAPTAGENTSRTTDDTHAPFDGPPPTTGLTPEERRLLAGGLPPVSAGGVGLERDADGRIAFESPSYSVDPLRQGRAYYRAGRFGEALVLLSRADDDLETRYWRARCHEKLDHFDQALAGYDDVARLGAGTALGDRARDDHLFLSWRRDFERRLTTDEAARATTDEPAGGKP